MQRQPLSSWLQDTFDDPDDFSDNDTLLDTLNHSRGNDQMLLRWAAMKPAMDAGLIPHEPRPRRKPQSYRADKMAVDLCKRDKRFVRMHTIAQEYGISDSVIRGWWNYHLIDGITLFDGERSVTVYYRADIDRVLKTWVPGKRSQNGFTDDDGVPQRIADAASMFRTEARLDDEAGRAGLGHKYPRDESEQSRGYDFTEQEIA